MTFRNTQAVLGLSALLLGTAAACAQADANRACDMWYSALADADRESAAGPRSREVALNEYVPGGYAGYYVSSSGNHVLRLVDTTKAGAARKRLSALVACDPAVPEAVLGAASVEPAEYTLSELLFWKDKLFACDISGIGISTIDNRISVGAADTALVRTCIHTLARKQGVPLNAVKLEEMDLVRF